MNNINNLFLKEPKGVHNMYLYSLINGGIIR